VVAYEWLAAARSLGAPVWRWVQETTSEPLRLPHRLIHPFSMLEGDREVLVLSDETSTMLLNQADLAGQGGYAIAVPGLRDGAFVDFSGAMRFALGVRERGFWLRMGGPYPRLLQFSWKEAAK